MCNTAQNTLCQLDIRVLEASSTGHRPTPVFLYLLPVSKSDNLDSIGRILSGVRALGHDSSCDLLIEASYFKTGGKRLSHEAQIRQILK